MASSLFSTDDFFKSEFNFCLFPFFGMSRQSRSLSRYSYTPSDNKSTLNIIPSSKYGFPTSFDYKLFKCLEYYISQSGIISSPISISCYKICQLLGITTGKNINRVKRSIKRLVSTTIESNNILKSKKRSNTVEINDSFHIIERVVFRNEKHKGRVAQNTKIWLSDIYSQNIQNNYTRYMNFKYFLSLNSNIARRLYDILSVKFHGLTGSHLHFAYDTLVDLLCITRHDMLSYIKRTLDPAHSELIDTGFCDYIDYKQIDGNLYIYYSPGDRFYSEQNYISNIFSEKFILDSSRLNKYITQLEDRGLNSARQIVSSSDRTLDEIELIIKDFDKRKDKIKNHSAYLHSVLTSKIWNRPGNVKTSNEIDSLVNTRKKSDKIATIKDSLADLKQTISRQNKVLCSDKKEQKNYFIRRNSIDIDGTVIVRISEASKQLVEYVNSNFRSLLKNLSISLQENRSKYKSLIEYYRSLNE